MEPAFDIPATCEKYRAKVQAVFGQYTDQALFTAGKESRQCSVNISDGANSNGTYDYCIFQINNEPSVQYDIDKCIARAWSKFKGRGYTWGAWYAVCPIKFVDGKRIQYQKFENIKCK